MNFAEIQNTWQSPHNRPAAAEIEETKMNLIADLKRRRRGKLRLLALVFIPLAYFTAKIVRQIMWPDPALDAVDLRREWGIVPFFLLPWIGWVAMAQLHRRHRARHANYDRSIVDSVKALLDENRGQVTLYKIVGVLLVVSVAVLPLIVQQLRAVGKVGDEILIPAYGIYPAYVVGVLGWAFAYYRRKLRPRRAELEALLASYERRPE